MSWHFRVWALAFGVVLAGSGPGCVEPIDTTREMPARGSLGAEIYEVFCQRIAAEEIPTDVTGNGTRALCEGREGPRSDTPPHLTALALNRTRLVAALDRIMPEPLEDDLGDFMLELLPFYDPPDERLPRQTRALAEL